MLCEKHRFPKLVETDFPIVPTKLNEAWQVDKAEQKFWDTFCGYPVC